MFVCFVSKRVYMYIYMLVCKGIPGYIYIVVYFVLYVQRRGVGEMMREWDGPEAHELRRER